VRCFADRVGAFVAAFGRSLRESDYLEGRNPTSFAQVRWKISVPRTLVRRPLGATYVAIPLVTTVVGLTKRPDQTVVALQSDVQFLAVWNTTREPRTRPARS
jgi:hypothetical protein